MTMEGGKHPIELDYVGVAQIERSVAVDDVDLASTESRLPSSTSDVSSIYVAHFH